MRRIAGGVPSFQCAGARLGRAVRSVASVAVARTDAEIPAPFSVETVPFAAE
jgi:hypothetical protein